MKFIPYYLETKRLILRCWEPKDAKLFHELMLSNIDHLKTYMPFALNEPLLLDDRIKLMKEFRSNFDKDIDYAYGIFDKKTKLPIGSTGLNKRNGKGSFEIGYWIDKNECNKGYATEISKAQTKLGFMIDGIDRMEIHCNPVNEFSKSIPQKLGYSLECIRKRINHDFPNEYRDTMIWVLFKNDYIEYSDNDICVFDFFGNIVNC